MRVKTWAKDTAGKAVKSGTSAAVKYLWPETLANDPFEPAELPPLRYMATMLQRIDERLRNLWHQINNAIVVQRLDLVRARNLAEKICDTSFIDKAPEEIDKKLLQDKAELGLWIRWACARDREYWKKYSNVMNVEVFEFWPVLDELVRLGVPSAQIWLMGSYVPAAKRIDVMQLKATRDNGLNMDGFIRWASGLQAIELLFLGVKRNQDTDDVKQKMLMRINLRQWGFGV